MHLNLVVEMQRVFLQEQSDRSRGERFGRVCDPEPGIWCGRHLVLEIRPAKALGPHDVTVDADRHRGSRQVLLRETGAHDLLPALHRVGPFSRRVRMRHGSHLLRVRVQDRRRDALVCPEPQNRRERQTDDSDDQRKPGCGPILCHKERGWDFVPRTPLHALSRAASPARSVRVARSLPLARATAAACFSIPKLHYPRDFVPRPPYTLSRAPLRRRAPARVASLAAARSRDRGGVFQYPGETSLPKGLRPPAPLHALARAARLARPVAWLAAARSRDRGGVLQYFWETSLQGDFVPRPPYTPSRAPLLAAALRSRGSLAAARSRDRGGVLQYPRETSLPKGLRPPAPLHALARRFASLARSVRVARSLPLARATAAACCGIPGKLHYPRDFVPRPPFTRSRARRFA